MDFTVFVVDRNGQYYIKTSTSGLIDYDASSLRGFRRISLPELTAKLALTNRVVNKGMKLVDAYQYGDDPDDSKLQRYYDSREFQEVMDFFDR